MKAAVVFQQSPSSKSLLDVEETGRCIDQLAPQFLRIVSAARWR
jgi:hypothetical protein